MHSHKLKHSCLATDFGICLIAVCVLLGCHGGKSGKASGSTSSTAPSARIITVAKVAHCAPGDQPETALQGQVPAALRASGFKGFNCNLKLVGQYAGEGGGPSFAAYRDRAGHACAYYSTHIPKDFATGLPIARVHPGLQVIDITDASHPMWMTGLTTEAMLDPWESLRLNLKRGILGATANLYSAKPAAVDFYDLRADCRRPQLLSSAEVGTGEDGGIRLAKAPVGHEGNFAPDGLTYYVGDVNGSYNAVDVSDPTHPKAIAHFDMLTQPFATESAGTVKGYWPGYPAILIGTAHGLSISDDGNRAYVVSVGYNSPADFANPRYKPSNGFYILDTTEVQERKPQAHMKLISATSVRDGTMGQHTLPMTVAGRPFLVLVDEGGAVASTDTPPHEPYLADLQAACKLHLPLFPMARIFDISDERHPREVSKLMLETHDPAHCSQILPDLAGLAGFSYGSHYCSVDNRANATALACGYFNSGVRVFDIREPAKPKEIAYYNPAGMRTEQLGSGRAALGQWQAGAADFCFSSASFDFQRRLLATSCGDNGLLVMQFENGVWPMPETSPAVGLPN